MLFSTAVHRDFVYWRKIYTNSPRTLSFKLRAIQELNKQMSDVTTASCDATILAVMSLAAHEVLHVTQEKQRPFNSPLRYVGWLNIYGNIE